MRISLLAVIALFAIGVGPQADAQSRNCRSGTCFGDTRIYCTIRTGTRCMKGVWLRQPNGGTCHPRRMKGGGMKYYCITN
jgi:hypothetical protein